MAMLIFYLFSEFAYGGVGRKEYSEKTIYITLSHFVHSEIFSSQENVKSFLFLNTHSRHFKWIFPQRAAKFTKEFLEVFSLL